jgi:hypothetical protein
MWSRVVEIMLGCWLLVAPFVFQHSAEHVGWWITDLAAGSAVIMFGLLSHARPTRHAHLLTLIVACGLIGYAFSQALGSAGPHVSPAQQNEVILGFLLLMFALVPNEASQPPESWVGSPQ